MRRTLSPFSLALALPALLLAGCGPTREQQLQAELDKAREEIKRAQDAQRAAQRELEALKKTQANVSYVEDGPQLVPYDQPSGPPPPGEPEVAAAGAPSEAAGMAPAPTQN